MKSVIILGLVAVMGTSAWGEEAASGASGATGASSATGEAIPRVEFGTQSAAPQSPAPTVGTAATARSATSSPASAWPGSVPATSAASPVRPQAPARPTVAPVRPATTGARRPSASSNTRTPSATRPASAPSTTAPPTTALSTTAPPTTAPSATAGNGRMNAATARVGSILDGTSSSDAASAGSEINAPEASDGTMGASGAEGASSPGPARLAGSPAPPLMPEVIPPRAFDASPAAALAEANESTDDASAAGETPEELGQFVSRRETLGRPSAIVPSADPAADALVASTETGRPAKSGNWYKLAAGALFLASLGLIGYRHNQRQRDRHAPFGARGGGSGREAGSWQAPRGPRVRANSPMWREPEPAPAYAPSFVSASEVDDYAPTRAAGDLWDEEPIARRASRSSKRGAMPLQRDGEPSSRERTRAAREAFEDDTAFDELTVRPREDSRSFSERDERPRRRRRAPQGEKVAGTSFVFEARSPNRDQEPSEIGYHDEIERRVRRMAAEREIEDGDGSARFSREEAEDSRSHDGESAVAPRRRRPSLREREYEAIADLAAEGRSARQIARELQVPVGEVEAVLNIRARGARPAPRREEYV